MSRSQLATLSDAGQFVRGITFKPEDLVDLNADNAVVCMRTKNVQSELDQSDLIAVPRRLVRREELYLRAGDILVSSANSWGLVGKCCWVPELPYPTVAGGFISAFRADDLRVNSRYLFHWLSSPSVQDQLRHCGRKTTNISNLNFELAGKIPVLLPSLSEQRRIAAILDEADAIRRQRQEAIRLTKELLRATFLEMFGDPATNTKEWPRRPMAEVVRETQYGTSEKANEERRGLPILRMNNITYDGQVDVEDMKWCDIGSAQVERYTVKRGDLLFNRTNSPELVGKTAVWNCDEVYAFAGYLFRVRFDQSVILPDYVSAYLNSTYGKKLIYSKAKPSNNMSNFSAGEFCRLEVPVPDLGSQHKFAGAVQAIARLKESRLAAVRESETLFSSLVQRAFRGEL